MYYIQSSRRLTQAATLVPDAAFQSKAARALSINQDRLKYSFTLGNFLFRSISQSSNIVYAYLGNVSPDANTLVAIFEFQPYLLNSNSHTINALQFSFIELKDIELGEQILYEVLNNGRINNIKYRAIVSDYAMTADTFNAFALLLKHAVASGNLRCMYSKILDCCVELNSVNEWISCCKSGPLLIKKDLQAVVFKKGYSSKVLSTIDVNSYKNQLASIYKSLNKQQSGPSGPQQAKLFSPQTNDKIKLQDWSILGKPVKQQVVDTQLFCALSPDSIQITNAAFKKRPHFVDDSLNDVDISELTKFGINPNQFNVSKKTAAKFVANPNNPEIKSVAAILSFIIAQPKEPNLPILVGRRYLTPNAKNSSN